MSSSNDRIAAALERIANIQEQLLEETKEQTNYLLRSEHKRDKTDALTHLFYMHTFKKDGFEFVIEGDQYKTIPVPPERWKADTEEIRAAGDALRKLLEKYTVKSPDLT
jgi:hypothetical protein